MMNVLEWAGEHPILSVVFALIAATTLIGTAEAIFSKATTAKDDDA